MKAGIFFTGTGPILVLTSFDSLDHPYLIKKLEAKGIKKYIAYEVQEDIVKNKYGKHYEIIMNDLHQEDDLRVLDYDGHHIYSLFSLKKPWHPIFTRTMTQPHKQDVEHNKPNKPLSNNSTEAFIYPSGKLSPNASDKREHLETEVPK